MTNLAHASKAWLNPKEPRQQHLNAN